MQILTLLPTLLNKVLLVDYLALKIKLNSNKKLNFDLLSELFVKLFEIGAVFLPGQVYLAKLRPNRLLVVQVSQHLLSRSWVLLLNVCKLLLFCWDPLELFPTTLKVFCAFARAPTKIQKQNNWNLNHIWHSWWKQYFRQNITVSLHHFARWKMLFSPKKKCHYNASMTHSK